MAITPNYDQLISQVGVADVEKTFNGPKKLKVWVVIDEGCQECGVHSVPVGIFKDKEEADRAANTHDEKMGGWRDGGQCQTKIYEMEFNNVSCTDDEMNGVRVDFNSISQAT